MCNASLDAGSLQLLGISERHSQGMKMPSVLFLGGCNIMAVTSMLHVPVKFLFWVSIQFCFHRRSQRYTCSKLQCQHIALCLRKIP